MQTNHFDASRGGPRRKPGTINPYALAGILSPRALWSDRPLWPNVAKPVADTMPSDPPREVFIQGITPDGRTFRPSDWAERLAGAMSSFRPEGANVGIAAFIGYSPLCVPRLISGVKCVIVNEALRDIEPMAWDFVMNFARDNQLRASDTPPLVPERPGIPDA